MKKLHVRKGGFTLIELMIVVAIIGILAAIAIPNFLRFQLKAKTSEGKTNLAAIRTAEQSYYSEFGGYVSSTGARPGGAPRSGSAKTGVRRLDRDRLRHARLVARGPGVLQLRGRRRTRRGTGFFATAHGRHRRERHRPGVGLPQGRRERCAMPVGAGRVTPARSARPVAAERPGRPVRQLRTARASSRSGRVLNEVEGRRVPALHRSSRAPSSTLSRTELRRPPTPGVEPCGSRSDRGPGADSRSPS